ncbi:MAG: glycosyltransferase family 4 protein [Bryobacteraceae bacterium]|jgi:glycosyltransferase involved in cell wall biosynthesis
MVHISGRADIGGGPAVMERLIASTQGEVESFAACPREEPYWSRFTELVGAQNIFEIPHRRFSLARLRRLASFVADNCIDLIHSHGLGAGLYSRPVGWIAGVPVVHSFHGADFRWSRPLGSAGRLLAEQLLGFGTRQLIAVSESEKAYLCRWLFPHARKIRVIPNGFRLRPEEVRAADAPSASTILWVGRMEASHKRPELIVAIARHLCRLRPQRDFTFDVVGGGPLLPGLRDTVRGAGLDGVIRLLGPQPDALPFYRNAAVFLSTSRWEGLPLTVLEAMTNNLAVVASRIPGTVDLVTHRETGLLYPKNDPLEAARLLNAVLDESFPVARMRRAASSRVARLFTLELQASRHLDLYREVVAGAKCSEAMRCLEAPARK